MASAQAMQALAQSRSAVTKSALQLSASVLVKAHVGGGMPQKDGPVAL